MSIVVQECNSCSSINAICSFFRVSIVPEVVHALDETNAWMTTSNNPLQNTASFVLLTIKIITTILSFALNVTTMMFSLSHFVWSCVLSLACCLLGSNS